MGTKQNPGRYDCYGKAEPDEPMFTLLARDPLAARVIRYWIDQTMGHAEYSREYTRDLDDKIKEASQCARDMEEWRKRNRE